MRNTKIIPTYRLNTRRENEDDSDTRGRDIMAAESDPDLVKGCIIDRG